jgi:hypothetical protein
MGSKGGRWLGLKTWPPSRADSLQIMGVSTSWSPKDLTSPVQELLNLYL